MKHEIVARPSYSALRVLLDNGEKIHTESGAMLAMDAGASIEGSMKGGFLQALKRTVLTSESFFVTTVTANANDTEVMLAPRAPGDIESIELNGGEFIVQGGSYLAGTDGVVTDAKFTGWKGFLSGEGIFMVKASGKGTLFVSSFGGIIKKELKKGEKFTVDNGHIVAFSGTLNYEIHRVGEGVANMVTTGEGLACTFEGEGAIYLQTRNLQSFAESLNPFLRDRSASQGQGFLGQIMGG